jgi:hypothetical protein
MMEDWNGKPIRSFRSKGGVLALADPFSGVVQGGVRPWPPAELIQKSYKSEHGAAFGDEPGLVAWSGQYYCDLQSLHCEDALTWSVFGTLARKEGMLRAAYAADLLQALDVPHEPGEVGTPDVWLWRRVPHPETLVAGGPEIDFAVQSERLLILGEAKWRSPVGKSQGVRGDLDQMQLRRMVVQKWHQAFFPSYTRFVLLLVRREGDTVHEDISLPVLSLHVRCTTWTELAGLTSHPLRDELTKYVGWKHRHSQP